MLRKWIVSVDNSNIEKRSAFWNMLSSMLGSAQSAIFLLVVTHVCDTVYAGIFSIATTLGYQIVTIGNYGMRNYQATDVEHKYSFRDYLTSRYISSILMMLFLIIYLAIKGYNMEKALIIFVFSVFKAVDVIEDVFHGEFQRYNRLDIGAICMTIRYVVSFVVFTIVLIVTKELLIACMWETLVSIVVFVLLTYDLVKPNKVLKITGTLKNAISLLLECFPLFSGGFLYLYICNAPKYAIDNCLSQESQAYFAIIFMPVFVVNLLSGFVYRPLMTRMAICWVEKKNKEFSVLIAKQLIFICIATLVGIVGAYLVGTQLLSWFYGVNVNEYRAALVVLMIGGGFAAITGYMTTVVLTIMRLQKQLLLGYGIVTGMALYFSNMIVRRYDILGAAGLYVLLMLSLTIYSFIVMVIYKKKIR